jgi:hypothetical protein
VNPAALEEEAARVAAARGAATARVVVER